MDKFIIGSGMLYVIAVLAGVIGYVTHILWCVKVLTSTTLVGDLLIKAAILGVGGIIVFPIGAIHGILMWFSGWTFFL